MRIGEVRLSPVRLRRSHPGGRAGQARHRHSWLELVQTTGPFLTLPVVDRVLPDGPPAVPRAHRAQLRTLVDDMLADPGTYRERLIETMLANVLGWGDHLRLRHELPDILAEPVPDHADIVRPTFGFYDEIESMIEADLDEVDLGDDIEDDNGRCGRDCGANEGRVRARDSGCQHPRLRRRDRGYRPEDGLARGRAAVLGVLSHGLGSRLHGVPDRYLEDHVQAGRPVLQELQRPESGVLTPTG
jgi:hypothetical protein